MAVKVKRVYEPPSRSDGFRVLVDRVWPRGLKKEDAAVDLWLKEAAPSTGLRRWFGHDAARWSEFKRRYFRELDESGAAQTLVERAGRRTLCLVFSARDERHNNAVALKDYLEQRHGL